MGLVQQPVIVNFNSKQNHSPYSLGIQSILSYCTSQNNDVTLLSCTNDVSENVMQIRKLDPCLVGFSINSSSEKIAKETIAKLKKETTTPIVVGGPSITYSVKKSPILSCDADLFVKGEGEVPFHELISGGIEEIFNGNKSIRGVFRRGHFNEDISRVDLTKMPSPHQFDKNKTHVYWETSRGCAFNCIYCSHPEGNDFFRTIPMDRLVNEVDLFKKMPNLKAVYITDPVIGGPKENTKKILKLIRGLEGKFITASLRPDYLDEDVINLLKQANIGWLDLGVQTIHPHLSYFRQNSTEGLRNLPRLKKEGVQYNLDLIFGIPGDTPLGFYDSLKEAIETFKPSSLKLFKLKIYEGTKLHSLAEKMGWVFDPESREIKSTDGFSERDIDHLATLSKNTSELYSFLEKNNWLQEEARLRKFDVFLRFNDYLIKHSLELDKIDMTSVLSAVMK